MHNDAVTAQVKSTREQNFSAVDRINPDQCYSHAYSARRLNISTRSLARLIADGKVRTIRVSSRRRPIPGSELIRILAGA